MLGGQFFAEQAIAAATGVLGAVHCNVGRAHQPFDRRSMVGADCDADRSADVDAMAVKFERLGNGEGNAAGNTLGVRSLLDLREEDREFIAGQAGKQRTTNRARRRAPQ